MHTFLLIQTGALWKQYNAVYCSIKHALFWWFQGLEENKTPLLRNGPFYFKCFFDFVTIIIAGSCQTCLIEGCVLLTVRMCMRFVLGSELF